MREKDVRFVLKDAGSKKATPVFLKYTCVDGIMKYSTGQKVLSAHWPKQIHKALRDQMKKLQRAAWDFIEATEKVGKRVKSVPLYNYLAAIDGNKLREEIVGNNEYFTQLQTLIDEAKVGKLHTGKNQGNYSKGTIVHWQQTYNKLKEFNSDLTWDITMETYDQFLTWCKEQGFQPNYIGTLIKFWKHFANRGLQKKWHTNVTHLNPDFKKPSEKKYKIYLDEKEIELLKNVQLTGMRKAIRDRYIINLNLGLRISDMKHITLANYKNGIISCTNVKTGIETAVPANKDIRRIIEEYGDFPKSYSEQVINREIKQVAKLAGIVEEIEVTTTKGPVKEKKFVPKWKLVCNHTCRRSFVSNKLKLIPLVEVAKYAGSSVKNIELYNKETVHELAARSVGSKGFE